MRTSSSRVSAAIICVTFGVAMSGDISSAGASSGSQDAVPTVEGLFREPGSHESKAVRGRSDIVGSRARAVMDNTRSDVGSRPSLPMEPAGPLGAFGRTIELRQPGGACNWAGLAVGTEVSGRLGAGDCSFGMLDGSSDPAYVEQFLVVLPLNADFMAEAEGSADIAIEIRNMAFEQLASASASAGAMAEVSIVLPAGEYLVLVRPSSFVSGSESDFTLRTDSFPALPPDGPCLVGELTIGAPTSGVLGRARACRVFDHLPGSSSASFADLWMIDVDQPGVLSIDVTGSFSPWLSVFDRSRSREIASDTSGWLGDPDPLRSSMTINVSAGRYFVLTAGASAASTGAYDVSTNLAPLTAGRCAPRDIILGEVVEGSLVDADCRLAFLSTATFEDKRTDLLHVVVAQPGTIQFNISGTGITPIVHVLDTDFRPLFSSTFSDGDDATMPFSGPMIIAVESLEGTVGDYSLEIVFTIDGTTPCALREIGTNASVSGALSAADCTLDDFMLISDSALVDLYVVRLPSRGRLTIDMSSTELDAYLWLIAGLWDYNIQNDDVGAGSDSRISAVLPAGDYLIVANSLEPAEGAYSLTTTFTAADAPSPCTISLIGPNETVMGALGPEDCLASDLDPLRFSASPAERHVLTLTERGRLSALAVSASLFPRLTLRDPTTGDRVIEDADEEDLVMEASIGLVLGPGTYWLEVEESNGRPDSAGAYSLTTVFVPLPRPACDVTVLTALPVDLTGTLDASDCMFRDVFGGYAQNRMDEYTFTVPRRGTLTIDMLSDDWDLFDPYVELHDFARRALAANNDEIEDFVSDARIQLDVSPGRYGVMGMEARLEEGDYDMQITFDPAPFEPPSTPVATPGPVEPTPTPRPGTFDSTIFLPLVQNGR